MHDSAKTTQITKNEIPNPKSQIRILLWDIDGTLMRSTIQGIYKQYFAAAMREVFGSGGNLDGISPAGMTDTQIICEALGETDCTPKLIADKKAELLPVFKREMLKTLEATGEKFEKLGGVDEILQATAANPRFVNALLTGNLSVAAEIKLKAIGVWDYFKDAPNAFGEISHKRTELAHESGRLFNEKYDYNFDPQQFIVIGDTPNDIACARDFGAKAIAVGTGRGVERETIIESKPDYFLEDLRDTKEVLRILLEL